MSEITRIIANSLRIPLDTIHPSFCMQDCERWDSLSHMNLITQLEQHYAVQFSMDEIIQMTTLAQMTEVIKSKCKVTV